MTMAGSAVNIKMNFIGLVVLVAMQITSMNALAALNQNEQLKLDLKDPTSEINGCLSINNEAESELHKIIDTFTFAVLNYTSYFTEIFESNLNRKFRPPPDNEFKKLEEEIKKIKAAIEALKNESSENSCTQEKLIALQEALIQFQKRLDDGMNGVWECLEEYMKLIETLTNSVNDLKKKLAELQKEFQANKQTTLRDEVIAYIKSGLNDKALKSLEKLGGNSEEIKGHINYVIHEVYNNQAGNFEFVIKFAEQGKNTTISLATYEALKYEMENNDHLNDYNRILRLIGSIKRKIVNNKSAPANDRKGAENIIDSIHGLISEMLFNLLKPEFVHENYKNVKELSRKVQQFYPEIYPELISKILFYAFNDLRVDQVVYFFMNHNEPSQSIYGYSAVFDEMRRRNRLDEYPIVDLAFGLKKAMDINTDLAATAEGNQLKYNLPASARVLAYSSRVCFRNVVNSYEYMYAATDGYKFDSDRRNVFTWGPGNQVLQADWKVIHGNESKYLIRNSEYNEYLYAADGYFNFDSDRRRVFTWVGGATGDKFYWLFEPRGDHLYIKNIYYWEYLLADDQKKYNDDRRYTFTWRSGRRTGDSVWAVQSC